EEAPPEEPEDDTDYVEVLFLGDSLFAQGREDGTDIASVVEYTVKGEECKVYNLAIGGSAAALKDDEKGMSLDNWTSSSFLGMAYLIAGKVGTSDFEQYHPEIMKRFHEMDKDKLDFIIIDYGVNDFLSGSKIGAYDPDNTNPDYSYFVNAYSMALDTLRDACPQATILACTPCYSEFYGPDGAYLGDGNTVFNGYGNLANYVGLVEYCVSQSEGVIYMDMYHGERMNLDAYTTGDYLLDGIHLTERGRRVYGAALGQAINRLRGVPEAEYAVLDIDNY
ncbi:MAG: SGNH/GDSL hydrolase family protein, partial [Lachnospiraceae bacterium]|nr:SGNH/GDSL hydrolase family protein [Lachnospiraceae bacterium]